MMITTTVMLKVMKSSMTFTAVQEQSDYIYQNLANSSESIHLSDFPLANASSVDEDLILEMSTLLEVISLGRSARNKANIKIRQPLSSVVVYTEDKKHERYLTENKNDVFEELNVKAIDFVESANDMVQVKIKPDFRKEKELK